MRIVVSAAVAALVFTPAAMAGEGPTGASREAIAALATRTFGWSEALETRGNAGPAEARSNISASPLRQAWIDTFADMIKRSYSPFGGLPQAFRNINPYRKGMDDYRPVEYGVSFVIQDPTIKAGEITRSPIPSLTGVNLYANALPGAEVAWALSTPDKLYFTMRFYPDGSLVDPQERIEQSAEIAAVKRAVGRDCIVMTLGGNMSVWLIPGNRLPVRAVTIGEALDAAEAGLKRKQASDQPSDPLTYNARMAGLTRARSRHAGDLNRPASVADFQFGLASFQGQNDPFESYMRQPTWPLYTVDPAVYARAAAGGPQWLVFSFPNPRYRLMPRDKALYADMTQRFDYQSAYEAVLAPGATPASAKAAYAPRPRP